jgi:RNA polymerase sigma-70 factor (ECF subfamily)
MKADPKINLSDEQLVKEYLKGDNNSLGILYDRYYSKVYHKCLSFSRNPDDAFDLAQDVLMKAFSNIRSFRGSSKFSTWLYSITTNHCISKAAKSKNECCLTAGSGYHIISDDIDDEEFEARHSREQMEVKMDEYLMLLPENDRKMLDLKYRGDYSVKDLQREFKLSASAVKMRLLRARHKMEQIITENTAA